MGEVPPGKVGMGVGNEMVGKTAGVTLAGKVATVPGTTVLTTTVITLAVMMGTTTGAGAGMVDVEAGAAGEQAASSRKRITKVRKELHFLKMVCTLIL